MGREKGGGRDGGGGLIGGKWIETLLDYTDVLVLAK